MRGIGLLCGVELVRNKDSKERWGVNAIDKSYDVIRALAALGVCGTTAR